MMILRLAVLCFTILIIKNPDAFAKKYPVEKSLGDTIIKNKYLESTDVQSNPCVKENINDDYKHSYATLLRPDSKNSTKRIQSILPHDVRPTSKSNGSPNDAAAAARSFLDTSVNSVDDCSLTIVFMDNYVDAFFVREFVEELNVAGGVAVFAVTSDISENEDYELSFDPRIAAAADSRRASLCSIVIVLASTLASLELLANEALKARLLGSYSRMVVLTALDTTTLHDVMNEHYTYSWMNTIFVNEEYDRNGENIMYASYSHLPFVSGESHILRTAMWSSSTGLVVKSTIFPEKFKNFHGDTINITALPYSPYWDVISSEDSDDGKTQYRGSDYRMIYAISKALNFNINVMPSADWVEVTQHVQDRKSLFATVIYVVLPERMKLYDYSYMFEFAPFTFVMAKPALKPGWQALYYPLSDTVWLSVLAMFLLVTIPFTLVNFTDWSSSSAKDTLLLSENRNSSFEFVGINFKIVTESVLATLLGQGIPISLPQSSISSRVLLGTWLFCAFIVATAYRSNLTASLTLPKYPTRAETLSELVSLGSMATIPIYGKHILNFFDKSASSNYKKLSSRIDVVMTSEEGLQRAADGGSAHMEARRYLELQIAEKFTDSYGVAQLYVGREWIFPGLSSWPIVHDAPYKAPLDRAIMAIIEAGLYEKWNLIEIDTARKEGSRRRKEKNKGLGSSSETDETDSNSAEQALTLKHMQGPFVLLILGLVAGMLSFCFELVYDKLYKRK